MMAGGAHTPVSPSWDHLATASDTGAVGACRNASRTVGRDLRVRVPA